VPIGTAAAIYVTVVGLLGVAFVWLGRRVPETARARRRLGVPVCRGDGRRPPRRRAPAAADVRRRRAVRRDRHGLRDDGVLAARRRSAVWIPAGIGAGVLAFFAAETLLGWGAMLTPLLGGTHLDGGRFYGLPNVAIGLLVGASLWVAQRLRTWIGVALVVGVALASGMPYLGSNLGAGVTLFTTAGLWFAVRERERLGPWRVWVRWRSRPWAGSRSSWSPTGSRRSRHTSRGSRRPPEGWRASGARSSIGSASAST
jgi:hypothetical protein